MGMLERLSDARGTLEGKIVAVILAILLVLPVATVTAFANGDADEEATTETEQTQTAEPEAVEEVADQGSTPVAESEPTQPVVSPEPAQPSGESVQQQPEGDSSAQQPVEDEEGQDVVLALDIDEGATVSVKNESGVYEPYTKLDTELAAKNGEDIEFTVKADEGYAIGGICYIDESGIKSELEPDAYDVFVIEGDDIADGAIIKVACGEAALLSEEEPEAANVVEDEWVYPTAPQNILGKSWCTTTSLEQSTFEASAATSLGSEEGAAPKDFASSSINKGGKTYLFHHARLQPVSDQQLSQKAIDDYFRPLNLSEDEKKAQTNAMLNRWYDSSAAITALRFNQSANTWEYRQATDWTAFSPNEMQLVLYYNQELHIGDNVIMNAKDWPYTEAEWVQGQGASTPSCVIYQIYSADNQKIGDQYRTYYYSPTADKPGMALSIAQYWEIQEVCVKAQPSAPSVEKKKAYKKVSSPNTYTELANQSGVGYTTKDTDNFDIPFVRLGGGKYPVWLVGLKVNALPSEQTLTVEYLDSVTEQPVKDAISVAAKKPNGTALPTWGDYNVRVEGGKLAGNLESAEITTNIGSEPTVVNFTINSENYASTSVRAVLDGNTLKLYFPRKYNVSYEWTGLDTEGVDKFVGADGTQTLDKPHDVKGIVTGSSYAVDSRHSNGEYAYALDSNGKVLAVYHFSGWKINGEGEVVTGNITIDSDVLLEGAWTPMTYLAKISAAGKTYDGDPLPAGYVIVNKNPFPGEASTYYFKKKGEEGLGSTDRPIDASEYVVTAVWPATNKHPEVTATDEFTIASREVTLKSVNGEKTFDGTPLTKHEYTVTEGSFVKNDEESLKVAYTGTQTDPGSSENFFTAVFENEPLSTNYKITTSNGQLAVTRATDAIATIVLTGASNEKTYDGVTEFEAIGLASIASETPGFNAGNVDARQFTFNNAVYTIEGINTSDPKSKDAVAEMSNNVTGDFVVKSANGVDVTSQFAINPVPGKLTVRPMAVTLASKSASKIYDGIALTAGLEDEDSIPQALKSEADIKAVGTLTDVKRVNNDPMGAVEGIDNSIEVVGKTDRGEGVNEYEESNYILTKDEGTLTVYPKALPPVDPDDPKPEYPYPVPPIDPDDPNGPKGDPYKDMKVGALDDKDYNGKSWESVQDPEVTSGQNTLAKGTDYVQASTSDTTNAGPVAVTITGQGNYCGTVEVPYRIKPVAVTVKVDDQTKKFGDSDRAFTYTVTGTVNGETISGIATSRTNPTEEVGTYEGILTASVPSQRNYNVTVENGKFIIIPPDAADIIARSVTTMYDGQDHSIVVEPVNGWTIEYAESQDGPWVTANPGYQDAGTYTVYVRITRPGTNSVGPISRMVTINPAPVTITVSDATKVAGADDPEFTGAIEGEVAGHELTGVSYFRKGDSEAVGTYVDDLTAIFDENGNYRVTVVDGDFTITPIAVPVTPPTPPTPGPLDTLITTVTDFLATPVIGPGAAAVEAIADDGNPLAQIEDDGTPMSAFDHPFCWVHYYILLGIIITAIYGGGVIARRLGYNHKVKKYEDDVLDEDKSKGTAKNPVANEGVQPTI